MQRDPLLINLTFYVELLKYAQKSFRVLLSGTWSCSGTWLTVNFLPTGGIMVATKSLLGEETKDSLSLTTMTGE